MNPLLRITRLPSRRIVITLALLVAAIFTARAVYVHGLAQSSDSSTQERKLIKKAFKDMPLVVSEVKNLQSETWHKNLEIEVKNVSDKPIYFILAYLIFPDERVPHGESAISLTYGAPENIEIERLSDPQDQHLDPGEAHKFTIPESLKKGLGVKNKKFPAEMKNLVIRFAIISFGDGTGFEVGQPRDLRWKGFKPPPKEPSFRKLNWSSSTNNSTPAQSDCGGVNCFSGRLSDRLRTSVTVSGFLQL